MNVLFVAIEALADLFVNIVNRIGIVILLGSTVTAKQVEARLHRSIISTVLLLIPHSLIIVLRVLIENYVTISGKTVS